MIFIATTELPYGWEKVNDSVFGEYYIEYVCLFNPLFDLVLAMLIEPRNMKIL